MLSFKLLTILTVLIFARLPLPYIIAFLVLSRPLALGSDANFRFYTIYSR